MSDNRKYYYLKLKENFFTTEKMVILESAQDGLLYSNLLLKMYLMSLKHNGVLMLGDGLPHTPQTIATFTRHQIGTVERAFAGCIANALIDQDVPVLMTNIPSILNRLTGMFAEDRAAFISALDDYSLLILDDLGVERNTEYALEQMFLVIDSRYRSRKPLIVTTNLKLEEIKNPPDLAHARIYDRIMERCAPVLFSGRNFREEKAAATKEAARGIVSPK